MLRGASSAANRVSSALRAGSISSSVPAKVLRRRMGGGGHGHGDHGHAHADVHLSEGAARYQLLEAKPFGDAVRWGTALLVACWCKCYQSRGSFTRCDKIGARGVGQCAITCTN